MGQPREDTGVASATAETDVKTEDQTAGTETVIDDGAEATSDETPAAEQISEDA